MNRPRLFLSAVSEELRTARKSVAATVRTLGYDPVSQDDFPTGYGELRQWLKEQIDSCQGLIQLVGQAYGAEPPEVDPAYGRVSYTQFEFLYAYEQKKKTWVIVVGDGCRRDKPLDQLDLPRDTAPPDPAAYQAERRQLQEDYLARLIRENYLRHTANNDTELQNIILRLRDELLELRQGEERRQRRLSVAIIAILLGLVILGGGGWLVYRHLHTGIQQVSVVNTEKIRAHLLQTIAATHRRELAEADAVKDWKERQRLREAADNAHTVRLSRLEELAASFAEIEGKGTATSVFKEMNRILADQGVDEAIAYVGAQRHAILEKVKARAAAARERNRADLQPLLKTAALYQTKGQAAEARSLYVDILAAEPDWPEALHAAFWFHVDQGDFARFHTTLAEARREYDEAQVLAQRLIAAEPGNTKWQRDMFVSNIKLGNVTRAQGKLADAAQDYGEGLAIVKKLAESDPGNTQWQRDLSVSYGMLGIVAEAQGKLADAAQAYGQTLLIFKKLAAAEPGNTEWQRDLSISYEKLGDVALALGKLGEAARFYGDGLEIAKKLAGADPLNTQWQRDLSVSYNRLGDVAVAQGKLADAARAYQDSLAIRKKLAESDHSNTQWQRDLSVSYTKLAVLAERQRKTNEAQGYWQQALEVLSGIEKRGLHLSPEDRQWLEELRRKVGAAQR